MSLNFEYDIGFNPVLGATILWSFALAYYKKADNAVGPELPAAMLVLPIAFHQRSRKTLHRMKEESGLLKALADNPELPVGLQRRLEATSDLSLRSLDLAIAAALLELDRDTPWPRYVPKRKTPPEGLISPSDDVRELVAASQRLGWWFSKMDLAVVYRLLRVTL